VAVRAEESLTSEGSPAALAVSGVEAAQSESYLVASATAAQKMTSSSTPGTLPWTTAKTARTRHHPGEATGISGHRRALPWVISQRPWRT
jgi:hypothetical protein